MTQKMKRKIAGLAIAAFAAYGAAGLVAETAALAAEQVHLKQTAVISGSSVMLSDIFSGIGTDKDLVIAAAPAPGQKLNFGARGLRRIAKRAGLDWQPAHGRELVKIERASRMVPLINARLAIEDALMAGHVSDEIEIEFAQSRLRMLISEDKEPTVQVHDLIYDARTRQFSASLSAPADDPDALRVSVKGRVHAVVEMPVPQRHIRPGEVIKASDIGWRKVRARQSTYNTIGSVEALIDHTARRPLIAGRLVRRTDVRPRELVRKSDFVTVHFRSAAMSLTTRGLALEAGARGDVIRIRNPRSKKIIEGKVVGPNVAIIQPPQIAALN